METNPRLYLFKQAPSLVDNRAMLHSMRNSNPTIVMEITIIYVIILIDGSQG